MVGHIYGKVQVLTMKRPHMFIKELQLYIDFYKELVDSFERAELANPKEEKRIQKFVENLISGIEYYQNLMKVIPFENADAKIRFEQALLSARIDLEQHAVSKLSIA